MLDEFSAAKISENKQTASTSSGPGRPTAEDALPEEDDFAKQLQAGMAELMGQLDNNPDMAKHFEEMMKELSGGAGAGAETSDPAAPSAAAGKPPAQVPASQPKPAPGSRQKGDDFQDTIRKTMERMQASGETASAAATSSSEEDMLAQMLKEMENGNFPGLGEGGEEDFNKMLLGMMEQLTNRDILYEPMKELHDKFPAWMQENRDKVKKEDLTRYEEQKTLVGEIVGRFDRNGYSDENQEDRDYIIERMQKMQAAGAPPPDLVGDMSSAQEALGDMDAGCPQQ